MKININVHSAVSAMVWWRSTQILSELFICFCMESWQCYSQYILFVVLCQHVAKSANEELTITFNKLVRTCLHKGKTLIIKDNNESQLV